VMEFFSKPKTFSLNDVFVRYYSKFSFQKLDARIIIGEFSTSGAVAVFCEVRFVLFLTKSLNYNRW
jgi:hypothetical protein